MRQLLPLTVLVAASGCTTSIDAPASASSPAAICRAEALGQFQGRDATQALGSEMLAASGATQLRWVPQGTMVPMIYVAGRVTVFLDEHNKVRNASCS